MLCRKEKAGTRVEKSPALFWIVLFQSFIQIAMSVLVQSRFGSFPWPQSLSARLIDGLREESDEAMNVHLYMLDTAEAFELVQTIVMSPDDLATLDNVEKEVVQEIYAALDYLGCWPRMEVLWNLLGWTWEIKTLVKTPSPAELRARPAFDPKTLPETPWPRDSSFFDPHEDWNILSLATRPDPTDLHLLPGWESDIQRPVATGLPCGDLAIQPTRHALARAVRSIFFDDEFARGIADLWYDPAHPTKAGFVIAGGAALKALTWSPDLRSGAGDIDLFFIGPQEDARAVMCEVYRRTICRPDGIAGPYTVPFYVDKLSRGEPYVLQTSQAFTFIYNQESVQLITRSFTTLEGLFASFDYGPCKVAITMHPDGQPQALIAREAAESLQTGLLRLDPYRPIQQAYFARARKYTKKGFGFALPFPVGWRGTNSTRELIEAVGGVRATYEVLLDTLTEMQLNRRWFFLCSGLRKLIRRWKPRNFGPDHSYFAEYSREIDLYAPRFPALLVPRDQVSWLGRLIDHITGFVQNEERTDQRDLFEVQFYDIIYNNSASAEVLHKTHMDTVTLPVPSMPGAPEQKPIVVRHYTWESVERALEESLWVDPTPGFERSAATARAFFETPVIEGAPSDPTERLRWVLAQLPALRELEAQDLDEALLSSEDETETETADETETEDESDDE